MSTTIPERWHSALSLYRYFVRTRWEAEAADRMYERAVAEHNRKIAAEIRRVAEWQATSEGVDLAAAFDAIDQEEHILT